MPWDCYRLRAAIVDFADGTLDDASRATVERHVSSCSSCAAAVLELREVPAELRRRVAREPGEPFWTRQREAILRAVEQAEPSPQTESPRRSASVRWATASGLAAAAVAIWVVVGSLSAVPRTVTQVASTRSTPAASTATVATDDAALEDADPSDPWSIDEGSLLSLADELVDEGTEVSEDELI